MLKFSFVFSVLSLALTGSALLGQDTQTIALDRNLQIPGTILKPGKYIFVVEDRLEDRAIIRITNTKKNSHEMILAVPNGKLNQSERGKLILFPTTNSDKQILQGWMCPSCQTALEMVYPKDDAVAITSETAKAVMAVDPVYDKLPKDLAPDDMKVVTLWLLSPKEVTPDQKGKGVAAAKYADLRNKQNTQTASAALIDPSAVNSPVSSTAANHFSSTARRMPHTASDTYTFGLVGSLLLWASACSYLQRRFFPNLWKLKGRI